MNDSQTQSDHDLLIELRTEMRGMRDDIKKMNDGTAERIADHEVRIRKLERWVWLAIGGLAIIEFIATIYLKRQ